MKIVYIAKHHSGGNDEEGAITYALEKLGHTVDRRHEKKVYGAPSIEGDLLLFHKWSDYVRLAEIRMPKVFWYFDLINSHDATLVERDNNRIEWMKNVLPLVDLGFCTDGDFVKVQNRMIPGNAFTDFFDAQKLHVLRQGFDERQLGIGRRKSYDNDLLITAISKGGGIKRTEFINNVVRDYGRRLTHKANGVHGHNLADLIVNHKIVLAPNYPVSDNYWSNRVYLTMGYEGLILHPYCKALSESFTSGKHLFFYRTYGEMKEIIYRLMNNEDIRTLVANQGEQEIAENHLYTHRCEQLLSVVKHRLGVG